jgi:hypothetical protein
MNDYLTINKEIQFPNGFTISDNRLEIYLSRFLSPAAYKVLRQYIRFWGSEKKICYPSLVYLNEVTGLSEKTIRKANQELLKKKFLKGIERGSDYKKKANIYFCNSIDTLMRVYYPDGVPKKYDLNSEDSEISSMIEEKLSVEKVYDYESDEYKKLSNFHKEIANKFIELYKVKNGGYSYVLDDNDLKALKLLKENNEEIFTMNDLLNVFFKTKNDKIRSSSYNLYFFLTQSVQRILINEYTSSNIGMWNSSVKKEFEKIKTLLKDIKDDSSIYKLIDSKVRFPGGSDDRDKYVRNKLFELCKKSIERGL